MRELKVRRHVARRMGRPGGPIDQRTTRHAGYTAAWTKCQRVEEISGCFKAAPWMWKTRFRSLERVGWMFTWAAGAYDLVHMRNLLGATP